jgi:hypothetical protein
MEEVKGILTRALWIAVAVSAVGAAFAAVLRFA